MPARWAARGGSSLRAIIVLVPLVLVSLMPGVLSASSFEYDGSVGDGHLFLPPAVSYGTRFDVQLRAGDVVDAVVTWHDPATELLAAAYEPVAACPGLRAIPLFVCQAQGEPYCPGSSSSVPTSGERRIHFVAPRTETYQLVVVPDRDVVWVPFHLTLTANGEAPVVSAVTSQFYLWPQVAACNTGQAL